jgi:predicted glycosyltransferase
LSARLAFYWHNGKSLGHTYESVKLIKEMITQFPEFSLGAVTGAFNGIETLPSQVDLFKVPGFRNFDGPVGYRPESVLGLEHPDLLELRSTLIADYLGATQPDALVVNHEPNGYEGELERGLTAISPDALCVLTLRGVLFDTARTRDEYFTGDAAKFLLNTYDRIHVNIDPGIFDLTEEYRLPREITRLLHYVGYLDRPTALTRDTARAGLGLADGIVLTAAMGGGQGAWPLWHELLKAVSPLDELDAILIMPGPYLEETGQRALDALAGQDDRVRVCRGVADITPYLAAADVFVGAAGASTISEVLATSANAVLLARQQAEKEQEIHSQALARRRLVRALRLDEWSAERVRQDIRLALMDPRPAGPLPLRGGIERSAALLGAALGSSAAEGIR